MYFKRIYCMALLIRRSYF